MIFDMLSTLCGCPSSSHRTIALVYGSQVDARQPATAQNMFWQLLFVVSLDNKRQVDHNVPVEATIVSTHARPRAAAAAMRTWRILQASLSTRTPSSSFRRHTLRPSTGLSCASHAVASGPEWLVWCRWPSSPSSSLPRCEESPACAGSSMSTRCVVEVKHNCLPSSGCCGTHRPARGNASTKVAMLWMCARHHRPAAQNRCTDGQ